MKPTAESPPSLSAEDLEQQGRDTELALQAGVMLIQSGCPGEAAVETVTQLLHGLGCDGVAPILVGADAFVASGRLGGLPVTISRPVAGLGVHLGRASALRQLGAEVAKHRTAPDEIRAQLEQIATLPSPYAGWQLLCAFGLTGLAFTRVMGGDLGSSVLAFVAGVVGELVRRQVARRRLSGAFATGLAAIVAGLIAAGGLNLGISHSQTATVGGSIMCFIPGNALVFGLVDISSGKYVMLGVQRLLTSTVTFFAIALGVIVGLSTVGLW